MNKTVIFTIFAGIVIVIIGVAVFFMNVPQDQSRDDDADKDVDIPVASEEYFAERMATLGVERIGQPIEGFDAFLYLSAFPALQDQDFHEVEALLGTYEFVGGALTFQERRDGPIHSAAQTVSENGMATLLKNVSNRLEFRITDSKSVDMILENISEGLNLGVPIVDYFKTKIVYKAVEDLNEQVYRADCNKRGGRFSTCGSPCDVDAEICILVCAITCEGITTGSGVMGQVLVGPQCPVLRFPPEEGCEDKPYETDISIFQKENSDEQFQTAKTDQEAFFRIELEPGEYILQAQGGNPFPACSKKEITVSADQFEEIILSCDTGIR